MEIDTVKLKERIMEYRLKNNVNQKDMAEKLGIAEMTYIKFMNDGGAKIITKMKIEKKLNELESE